MCFKVYHYTPTETCFADLYRCIKRGVGRSLKRTQCKGNLVPSRKQATHKSPGTKGGLFGPKRVSRPLQEQHSCYSHRQHQSGCLQRRGMKLGPLYAFLLRILTWCARKQFTLKARHIPGQLNVVTDKLSRLGLTIQTEWSLCLCYKVHQFQTPWPGPWMHPYTFPPVAIMFKVVKLQDYPCRRIILIAPGWPNMPWFWDLVTMSSEILR